MIIKKYSTMNISTALLLCDLLIVVMAFFVFDILTGLCSILGLMAKTLVIDKVIERMKLNKFFTIVCDYPEPICDFITENSVTLQPLIMPREPTLIHREPLF